ncbi:MAG TPA: DinB family protein [Longimicrobium sp.]|nr:DinB family protein [Longimicrobium sp.]
MTDTAATSTRPAAFGDLEPELANTRRVLERVPDEHWEWKPHEKSTPLGRLATHLAEIPMLAMFVASRDEFNVAGANRWPDGPPTNREGVLAAFDNAVRMLTQAVDAVAPDAWGKTWQLKAGDQVFFSAPRAAALRAFGISHMVHHRAQLGVYLRLLDVPVPAIYGPSADEGARPAK